MLTHLFSSDAAYRLTLSLGHTLWQGVAIGAAALVLARMLRGRSAQARHLTYMAALLAMVLCLPANLLWVAGPDHPAAPPRHAAAPAATKTTTLPADSTDPGPTTVLPPDGFATIPPDATGDLDTGTGNTDETTGLPLPSGMGDEALSSMDAQPPAAADSADPQPVAPAPPSRRARTWRTAAPWVVPVYLLGLLLAGLRLVLAYRGGQQLRRLAVCAETHAPTLLAHYREQARRIGLRYVPEFAVLPKDLPKRFAHVGPVVIGVLKPVVLLPAAALTQMTPAQVEAVLAHELAHIKRYDPWLMLFQRAAETALFFHPMVWLISRLASVEREHACDDLALNAGAQPGHYAEALLHFAKQQASGPPRSLAAAALAMAQRSEQGKALEHRLARLFGQRIPNPLRLTRKGLLGLTLVGLVGLTALVTTTRAQPPGPYFAEAEIIPKVAYPDDGRDPNPPLAMEVKYVRPTHTDVLFDPDGNRLEETWDDASGRHSLRDEDDRFRDIIIEIPQDAPELTFVDGRFRFERAGGDTSQGAPFFAHMCYRADGSRYILLDVQINRDYFARGNRFDITLAYHVGEERGAGDIEFAGPFEPGVPFTDTTGQYQTQLDPMQSPYHDRHALVLHLDRYLPQHRELVAYDHDGKVHEFVDTGGGGSSGPNGTRGTYRYRLESVSPRDISRIVLNPEPRTITFRNVALSWDDYEENSRTYEPYLDEMAQRLGVTVHSQIEANALTGKQMSLEEALSVMDVVRDRNTIESVWYAISNPHPRPAFDDLTAEQQAIVISTANHWVDASEPRVQQIGLEMGLWTGDMRFWEPATAYIQREGYRNGTIMLALVEHLHDQFGSDQYRWLVELADSTNYSPNLYQVIQAFRYNGQERGSQHQLRTTDALMELAHHDKPWVWIAAINRIYGRDGWSMSDLNGKPLYFDLLRQLAAESDEMLRRCAIVVPDAEVLGRPLPPREDLRLEEVFTPAMWRMLRIGDFFALYDHWVTDDPADLDQWGMVIGFLDQLDEEWSLSRGNGWSRDNGVIVHRVVQHLNAVFDQDLGGLGQVRTETASRVGHGKDYRQIARDAVAWYRGADGSFPDRGFRRPSVVSMIRADDSDWRWIIGEGYGGYLAEGLAFVEPVGEDQHAVVRGNAGGSNGTPYEGSVQLRLETKSEDGVFTITRTVVDADDNSRRLSSVESGHAIPEGAEVQVVTSRVRSNTAMIGTGYTALWEARFVRDGEVLQSIVYAVRALMPREVGGDSSKHFEPRMPEGRAMPRPEDPRLHFAAVPIEAEPEVERADLIGTWRLEDADSMVQYTDAAGRAVRVVQTLTLREDGSAVRQVVRSYEDDPVTPAHYERFEGHWALGEAEPLDGEGPGLSLRGEADPIDETMPQAEDGWDAQLVIVESLGNVWSVETTPDGETVMTTARWATDLHLIDKWKRIDADDATELDPGAHGSVETAEAFIAALLTARVGDAQALTHGMDERSCGRFAELALLDIGDDFGATVVYRDRRDRPRNEGEEGDEREAGEAAAGGDASGGETIGVVFAPIVVPTELADKDEEQRMALIVELQQVDGRWRVTGIEPEAMGEDFDGQFQQAHDTGRIEIIPHEAAPLPPRIVGYRDPKPLDLHRAIMAGDLDRVEALLDAHPAWVHARLAIEENNTPLHTAITQACWSYNKTEEDGRRGVALFELLLDRGADIDAVNDGGRTVLSYFCGWYAPVGRSQSEAGLAALRLLLERGADVGHTADDERTPLFSLALSSLGHRQPAHEPIADAAELLLEAGADPNHAVGSESDERMRTPMHLAIYSRNPHLLAVLLEHGADPAGPNMQALPPLHALAVARYRNNTSDAEYKAILERDTLACARQLVEHGADPWTRVLSDRGYTVGATNLRGMECTAWDWAPDSAMREYLGELMAPKRAELEAETRAIGERFVRAALAGDAEAMRADTAEVFVYHDGQPTERMLPHVVALLRDQLDVDPNEAEIELPIVAVTGRLREGGIMLRNKAGAESPYTAILTIHDGERWRVIGVRQTHREEVMGPLKLLFGFERESVDYVRYQTTGELPVAFRGSRSGGIHRGEFAVVGLDAAGQMTMQWHGRGRHIATTQLTRTDTDGVIHINHTDLDIHHNQGKLTYNDIELTHNSVLLPDGTRLVTVDGQLAVLKDGNADLIPPDGSVRIDLADHSIEATAPAPPGDGPVPGDADDAEANADMVDALDRLSTFEKGEALDRAIAQLAAHEQIVETIQSQLDQGERTFGWTHRAVRVLAANGDDAARDLLFALAMGRHGVTNPNLQRWAGTHLLEDDPSRAAAMLDSDNPLVDNAALQALVGQPLDQALHDKVKTHLTSDTAMVRWTAAYILANDPSGDFITPSADAIIQAIDRVAELQDADAVYTSAPQWTVGEKNYAYLHSRLAMMDLPIDELRERAEAARGRTRDVIQLAAASGGDEAMRGAVLALIEDDDAGMLRVNAIHTLRLIGTEADLPLLDRLAEHDTMRRETPRVAPPDVRLNAHLLYPVRVAAKDAATTIRQRLEHQPPAPAPPDEGLVPGNADDVDTPGNTEDAPDAAGDGDNGARGQAEEFGEAMATAIRELDAEALSALLERGADPNAALPNGLLPLHAVVSARDRAGAWADPAYDGELNDKAVACASLLVEAGADPWGRMIARGSDGAWWYDMEQPALDTITPGNMREKPLYAYLEGLMQPRIVELRREVHTALHAFIQAAIDDDIEAMLATATPVWPSHRNYFPQFMAAKAEDYRETLEMPTGDRAFVLPVGTDWVREQAAGVLLRNRDGAEKPYTLFLLIQDGNAWRVINSGVTESEDVVSSVWNLHGQFRLIHYFRFAASGQAPPLMSDSSGPQALRIGGSETAVIRLDDTDEIVLNWMSEDAMSAQTYLGRPDAEGVVHIQPGAHSALQHLEAVCGGLHLTHDTVTLPDNATLQVDDAGRLMLRQGETVRVLEPDECVQVSLDEGSYLISPDVEIGTMEPIAE
ncbi:MAG: M56 family metallopeptidase [Planctomycetota bacterium]